MHNFFPCCKREDHRDKAKLCNTQSSNNNTIETIIGDQNKWWLSIDDSIVVQASKRGKTLTDPLLNQLLVAFPTIWKIRKIYTDDF